MNDRLNCWDFKDSCNETAMSDIHICPAKKENAANGLNSGINGGRICWVIMDSHCKKKFRKDCSLCEFRYRVIAEEGLLNNCNATWVYLKSVSSE